MQRALQVLQARVVLLDRRWCACTLTITDWLPSTQTTWRGSVASAQITNNFAANTRRTFAGTGGAGTGTLDMYEGARNTDARVERGTLADNVALRHAPGALGASGASGAPACAACNHRPCQQTRLQSQQPRRCRRCRRCRSFWTLAFCHSCENRQNRP